MKVYYLSNVFLFICSILLAGDRDTAYNKFINKCIKHEGCINLFEDSTNDKHYIEISRNQLNKPFLFTTRIRNAAPETFLFQGNYVESGLILRMNLKGEKIVFSIDNNNYFIDPASTLAQVTKANAVDEILEIQQVSLMNKNRDKFLINLDSLFLSEKMATLKFYFDPDFPLKPEEKLLGDFNFSKSFIDQLKTFHTNIVIKASLNFNNANQGLFSKFLSHSGDFGILPYKSINVELSYIISELPDKPMDRRVNHPSVGYWVVEQEDLLSPSASPWHDCITRWRLEKKNPELEISDPIKPIIFYLDNATPVEWRDIIIGAVEKWNMAFRNAGFSNAVKCIMEPDNQEYDVDDLSRNMIIWTAGAAAGFVGYGPSVANPLTGEILGADIILDYSFLFPRVAHDLIMLRGNQHKNQCQMGNNYVLEQMLNQDLLTISGSPEEIRKMQIQGLEQLVLHEVGHTLGLTHNFIASHYLSPEEIEDKKTVEKKGLIASVMDYQMTNLHPDLSKQTDYFLNKPGVYDEWAILYGYSTPLTDPEKESKRLLNIANQSNLPGLAYGNDSDASDETTTGIDPDIIRFDLSTNAIANAKQRLDQIRMYGNAIISITATPGASRQALLLKKSIILFHYERLTNIIASQIGGIHMNRSQNPDLTLQPKFIPVDKQTQKLAIQNLNEYIFKPTAFNFIFGTFPYLMPERRNFEKRYYETNDPKIQQEFLGIQKTVLNQILNPVVLARFVNSNFYNNDYKIEELFNDLSNAIFDEDSKTDIHSIRQNLQFEYVKLLLAMLEKDSKQLPSIQSAVTIELLNIKKKLQSRKGSDTTTGHRKLLTRQIDQFFSEN